jgi:hypothetical protein
MRAGTFSGLIVRDCSRGRPIQLRPRFDDLRSRERVGRRQRKEERRAATHMTAGVRRRWRQRLKHYLGVWLLSSVVGYSGVAGVVALGEVSLPGVIPSVEFPLLDGLCCFCIFCIFAVHAELMSASERPSFLAFSLAMQLCICVLVIEPLGSPASAALAATARLTASAIESGLITV